MVQTLAVFMDEPTTAKLQPVNVLIAQLLPPITHALVAKIRTIKISSGASGVFFL